MNNLFIFLVFTFINFNINCSINDTIIELIKSNTDDPDCKIFRVEMF